MRAEGATPATVGVIDGEVRVGLSSGELDHLARCKSSLKVSRRDLPYVVSKVSHKPQDHLGFSSFLLCDFLKKLYYYCTLIRGFLEERQCRPQ